MHWICWVGWGLFLALVLVLIIGSWLANSRG